MTIKYIYDTPAKKVKGGVLGLGTSLTNDHILRTQIHMRSSGFLEQSDLGLHCFRVHTALKST